MKRIIYFLLFLSCITFHSCSFSVPVYLFNYLEEDIVLKIHVKTNENSSYTYPSYYSIEDFEAVNPDSVFLDERNLNAEIIAKDSSSITVIIPSKTVSHIYSFSSPDRYDFNGLDFRISGKEINLNREQSLNLNKRKSTFKFWEPKSILVVDAKFKKGNF